MKQSNHPAAMDQEIKELLSGFILSLTKSQIQADQRHRRLNKSIQELQRLHAETERELRTYMAHAEGRAFESDARMTRIERSLEGLILALARQHSNGHTT